MSILSNFKNWKRATLFLLPTFFNLRIYMKNSITMSPCSWSSPKIKLSGENNVSFLGTCSHAESSWTLKHRLWSDPFENILCSHCSPCKTQSDADQDEDHDVVIEVGFKPSKRKRKLSHGKLIFEHDLNAKPLFTLNEAKSCCVACLARNSRKETQFFPKRSETKSYLQTKLRSAASIIYNL